MTRTLALAILAYSMCSPAMAAEALTKFDPVPPVEYDRPFNGTLEIYKVGGQEDVRATGCPKTAFVALGCAFWWANPSKCVVILADDAAIKAVGHDPEIVLRHEIAHCNGWPASHSGARPVSAFVRRPLNIPEVRSFRASCSSDILLSAHLVNL
jgi:hypothetical protein